MKVRTLKRRTRLDRHHRDAYGNLNSWIKAEKRQKIRNRRNRRFYAPLTGYWAPENHIREML